MQGVQVPEATMRKSKETFVFGISVIACVTFIVRGLEAGEHLWCRFHNKGTPIGDVCFVTDSLPPRFW
jgi:hypothetical protein